MSIVSIRISEKTLHEVDVHAQALQMPRTVYIREAIEHMNNEIANRVRKRRLRQASLRVRKESMRVNKEFNRVEYDPES